MACAGLDLYEKMNSKLESDHFEGSGISGTEVKRLPRVKAAEIIQMTGTSTTKLAAINQAYARMPKKKLVIVYHLSLKYSTILEVFFV